MMFKIFLMCLGLHFFVDYTLQGWLAQAKCRSWWEENYPQELYRHDWICALFCHSLYWTLFTFAPIIYLWDSPSSGLAVLLTGNFAIHAITDDMKANARKISLCTDQLVHLGQIVLTIWVAALVVG